MRTFVWISFFSLFLFSVTAVSDPAFTQRKDVQKFIKNMVKTDHFSKKELTDIMEQVQLQPQIIKAMNHPYEKKNWDVYRDTLLSSKRLKGGLDYWRANKATLEKVHKRYGVPPEIVVAILGVETLYGERQGNYRVLDALATIAFDYPKRSAYFTRELREYILLCKEHKVSPTSYKGSYAGAMGMPQFMPSNYRFYAIDFDNKGSRDLITNNEDTIASVANFFNKHGWQTNEGIAQHAQIKGKHYKHLKRNPKSANYRYTQLEKAGVSPITAAVHHPSRAALLELATAEGNEYWIAYPNFFVITRYNNSPQYALLIYLLAQQLKLHWIEMNQKKHRMYT